MIMDEMNLKEVGGCFCSFDVYTMHSGVQLTLPVMLLIAALAVNSKTRT